MQVSNPYYLGVKVPKTAISEVLSMVKEDFYNKSKEDQLTFLQILSTHLSNIYDIDPPEVILGESNVYFPSRDLITLEKPNSIISLLHEFRHHVQHKADKLYKGHSIEEDARAWSLRIFRLACPSSFFKSVKNNRIQHVYWDGESEEVLNSRGF